MVLALEQIFTVGYVRRRVCWIGGTPTPCAAKQRELFTLCCALGRMVLALEQIFTVGYGYVTSVWEP